MNKKIIVKHIGISTIITGSTIFISTYLFKKKYPKSIKGTIDNIKDEIIKDWLRKTSVGLVMIGSIFYYF